jgi:CubicO group peptidase (beta-lactamase class C family)
MKESRMLKQPLRRWFGRVALAAAALLPLVAPAALSAQAAVAAPTAHVYPAAAWEWHASPESVGWSSEALARVTERLSEMPSTGLMAVVGGRVLFDYGDIERVSYLASVRKSILSMLVGIYRERGVIDLTKTLADMGMDDHQGLTDAEKQATMLDLLTARSGIYHPASNSGDDLGSAPERGSQAPGSYYLYSNWDFNALGTAFEKQTGIDIFDALEQELARPLGLQDFDRATHRKSGNLSVSQHPAYHMNLSTRDMARIGYVMLREGRWDDRQLIPRDYVLESTRAFTPRSEMNPARRRSGAFGYGYLWWVFDNPELPAVYNGAYIGLGAVGQHILVMPALDLVVVHKTAPGGAGSVSHDQFLQVLALLLEAAPQQR